MEKKRIPSERGLYQLGGRLQRRKKKLRLCENKNEWKLFSVRYHQAEAGQHHLREEERKTSKAFEVQGGSCTPKGSGKERNKIASASSKRAGGEKEKPSGRKDPSGRRKQERSEKSRPMNKKIARTIIKGGREREKRRN